LLRSLKSTYPEARITFLVKKQYADLLSSSPYIDQLISFDQKRGLGELKRIKKRLQNEKFDLYLDIHKNWRSRYLRAGMGAKIFSYNKLIFKRTILIWFKINLYRTIKPVYERYFDSVKDLGIKYDGKGTDIFIPESGNQTVHGILTRAGFGFGVPLIILCPGATYFNKRWEAQGFIETGKVLIREKSAFIIVHGGPEDSGLCKNISDNIGEHSVSLAGLLSLSESAALLKQATVVIANDSGLLHLAQSQKVPVVGIYGPTTRELGYFPVAYKSIVVETDISCRPCTHNGLDKCPRKHFRCMKEISADKVIAATMQYLP
jgi:ADP-heptose:LPS heptosyltransferase